MDVKEEFLNRLGEIITKFDELKLKQVKTEIMIYLEENEYNILHKLFDKKSLNSNEHFIIRVDTYEIKIFKQH